MNVSLFLILINPLINLIRPPKCNPTAITKSFIAFRSARICGQTTARQAATLARPKATRAAWTPSVPRSRRSSFSTCGPSRFRGSPSGRNSCSHHRPSAVFDLSLKLFPKTNTALLTRNVQLCLPSLHQNRTRERASVGCAPPASSLPETAPSVKAPDHMRGVVADGNGKVALSVLVVLVPEIASHTALNDSIVKH